MDKRKLHISLIAGLLVLALAIGLAMPMEADAARSDELRAQLNALQSQAASINAQIAELKGQIAQNTSDIEQMVV